MIPNSNSTESIPSHFLVRFDRNEDFVGRETVLEQLLKRFPPRADPNACQRTVVEGLGGIGKTQVAIKAAYRVREAHRDYSVFWVPAVDITMFKNAYRAIGRALRVKGIKDDKADVKALVKAALSRDETGPWLFIINIDNATLLRDGQLPLYLPFSRQGSILFTTRNHQAAARLQPRQGVFRLGQLSDLESEQLLHQGLQPSQVSDSHSTTALLEYLTYLPLAIKQASAYMALHERVTVAKYMHSYQSSDQNMIQILSKDFEDPDRYKEIGNAIAATWLVSQYTSITAHPQLLRYREDVLYVSFSKVKPSSDRDIAPDFAKPLDGQLLREG
ncbi:purine and uridine phosphorylase [Apiospora aurea]|uniref:Purine and uridine phosphorylase n=1 Tax=Apiospora aurea TaxID=335848 RepID=A0ABR1QY66_9PEZI